MGSSYSSDVKKHHIKNLSNDIELTKQKLDKKDDCELKMLLKSNKVDNIKHLCKKLREIDDQHLQKCALKMPYKKYEKMINMRKIDEIVIFEVIRTLGYCCWQLDIDTGDMLTTSELSKRIKQIISSYANIITDEAQKKLLSSCEIYLMFIYKHEINADKALSICVPYVIKTIKELMNEKGSGEELEIAACSLTKIRLQDFNKLISYSSYHNDFLNMITMNENCNMLSPESLQIIWELAIITISYPFFDYLSVIKDYHFLSAARKELMKLYTLTDNETEGNLEKRKQQEVIKRWMKLVKTMALSWPNSFEVDDGLEFLKFLTERNKRDIYSKNEIKDELYGLFIEIASDGSGKCIKQLVDSDYLDYLFEFLSIKAFTSTDTTSISEILLKVLQKFSRTYVDDNITAEQRHLLKIVEEKIEEAGGFDFLWEFKNFCLSKFKQILDIIHAP